MKVDPNQPILRSVEYVWLSDGVVELHTGERIPRTELSREGTAFHRLCTSLDPNRTFLSALLADDGQREVFFAARDASRRFGIHMQSTLETAGDARRQWQAYKAAKSAPDGEGAAE